MIRWPGHVPAGKVENGIISGLDWFPTFLAAAGDPNIIEELKKGKELDGMTYKVHLDGYNQLDMITGKGPSNRHEVWYFGESELGIEIEARPLLHRRELDRGHGELLNLLLDKYEAPKLILEPVEVLLRSDGGPVIRPSRALEGI
jgi:hypothetical protein